MRVRTEEKKQQILSIAGTLFLRKGFSAVSMSDISAAVGGSKATLYGYFASKEDIFIAVMLNKAQALGEKAYSVLLLDLPLRDRLRLFGLEYLSFVLSQDMIDMKRVVIAQAGKKDIGSRVYDCGIKRGWGKVAEALKTGMADGLLKRADTWDAAAQFKALLEADVHIRRMLGVDKRNNRKALERQVDAALDLFWTYYAR